MINLGYKNSDFLDYLSNISVDEDLIRKKEYDKLYKKLSLKYSGSELDTKIKQKMYAKGFKIWKHKWYKFMNKIKGKN